MCYIHGSVEQAISTCSMCKVFRPTAARCPHVREICRNRQLHPSHDVVFIKNAEVQTFNGCGYCKWASANPLVRAPGAQNPGWPGCCRPPSASEARFIPPADWQAVMTVHKVPPPPEIKALLDSARGMVTAPPPARSQASPKTSENPQLGTPPKSPVALTKSAPQVSIPGKGSRSNTSPKQPISPLAREASRASPVLPSAPPPELRRTASSRDASRRENSPGTRIAATMSAGSRRSLDQQPTESVTVGRRSTNSKRPPLAAAMAQMTLEDPRQNLKRRGSNAPDGQNASPPRLTDVKNTGSTSTRSAKKSASVEDMKAGSGARPSPPASKASSGPKSPSSASSDGTASTFSESTVTSEGFTDYLSDESEAELQRQAEVRAAKAAQNAEEDMEFRSARKALARVDLRPPTSWRSATVGTRSGKGYPPPNGFDSRQQVNIMELARSK